MAQLWEYIKMAVSNIRMNRGRSFLTMLGIIIGVSSVILIMSIGNGAKAEMEEELTSVAGGQIYISVNSNLDGETPSITEEDRDALREMEHVKGATSVMNQWSSVATEKGTFDAIIDYGNPDSEYSTSPEMLYGQWFTWDDYNAHRAVAVIAEMDAIRMFGTSNVVGLTFELDDGSGIQDVRIVGVKKAIEGTFVSSGYGSYLDISMPMTADWYWAEYNDFDSVYIFAETGYAKEVTERAISLLESRHEIFGEDAFMSEDFDSQMASIMQVLDMITIFIMLVAGISLLVGGIGVMNIMLVSVTERTREIGIRKALGARTKSILVQFLAESAIITGIGGMIGITLGIAGAYGVCSLPIVTFPPEVSISAVVFATLFSCSVGIFFGIYPARKAAHLSPIEALRRN
ncbi:MAG: FtsX-like permease family protein [Lachnospiraceae bacterium]|jgi:putative ABC transport system permease protein|nr:FtsX-like permease family protein [Lachnospiraceae bacterium]MCI9601612.1 FtsX-like permease family protein [Lachnospiraceae bacterium]